MASHPNSISKCTNLHAKQTLLHVFCLFAVTFLGTRLIPFFGSANINAVVDAYCHALFAVRPRRRYVIGFDAKLMQLASLLPSCILDLLFLSPLLRAVPSACRH